MSLFSLMGGDAYEALKDVPGPTPHFPMGNSVEFIADYATGKQAWEISAEYARKYGPMTVIWMGKEPTIFLNDGKLISDVLISEWNNFYKDNPSQALIPVTTKDSPFVLNGEAWKKQRESESFSQPWFQAWVNDRVPALTDYMLKRADGMAGTSSSDDYAWDMIRLTFDAFSVAVLGRELPEQVWEDFRILSDEGSCRIKTPLPVLPPPLSPKFYIARERWFSFFDDLVAELQEKKEPGNLITAIGEHPPTMDQKRLAISIANIYFGGAFSVAAAVGTNLFLLSRHPEAYATVRKELQGNVSEGFDNAALEGSTQLIYSTMESMRLLTPVPIFGRNSLEKQWIDFNGYRIPPNTVFFLSNWYIQREAAPWTNGEAYDPQRWANGVLEANPIGGPTFFPFGMGPRECMGRPFALMCIKTMLAALHAKLDVTFTGDYEQNFYFGVMLPKKGLMATYKGL